MKFEITIIAALCLSPVAGYAQDDSAQALDDSTPAAVAPGEIPQLDDADMDATSTGLDAAQAGGTGPIAFGTVLSSGSKSKGTDNWSASFNASDKRYEITIAGQSYYYLDYATVITAAGDDTFCRSSSVGGKLLVYCYDHTGNAQASRFGFATFRP